MLYHGDCVEIIKTMEDDSVDCVITDPPYPEIKRDYGRMTESAWMDMMHALVPQIRRVLRPSGSAVFVLQPNSEKIGRMRLWIWDFMSWIGREWNVVQDAYWTNPCVVPSVHASKYGLMRSAVKYLVWTGSPDCYRDQGSVLWRESDANQMQRMSERLSRDLEYVTSGQSVRRQRVVESAARRGGVTPFNFLPIPNSNSSTSSASSFGHGAGTPYGLAQFWIRYICPPHGVVFDPFAGVGTIPLCAIENGRDFVGIEKMEKYYEIAKRRIAESLATPRTLRMEI
jgi:DNA modification methylase